METLTSLQLGFLAIVTNPHTILALLAGVFGGMIFGAIPGLTAALGVTLMLPFTYSMSPNQGITTLIAIYVGGISGGLTSACLLNIPGTAASIVTCYDGSPMVRKGEPGKALSYGITSSLIGGLFSGLALVMIAPQLAKAALICGSWEYFAMGILGMSIVVALCSDDLVKGFIGAIIGMLLAMVGIDPLSNVERFTFGFWQLGAGLDMLAALMGLFALTEILTQAKNIKNSIERVKYDKSKMSVIPTREMFSGMWKALSVSSIIGTIIGILPGVGQTTASMLSYNQVRSMSKTPEEFGKGAPEGIIASEAANNAVCGGALIPMMTLGIPGDMVTAILLGGLVIHGLAPGPQLFEFNPDFVGSIYVSYLLSCIVMFVMYMILMKFFIKVLSVPLNYLFPLILLMCVIGTITTHNRIFDSWVFLVVGVIGYILLNSGIALSPIVLGYVLGNIIELNFRTSIISYKGDVFSLFQRPIALALLALSVVMVVWPIMKKKRAAGKQKAAVK